MQILHIVIAVIMLILAAYYAGMSITGMFVPEAELKLQMATSATAAGLALAALYVLHW